MANMRSNTVVSVALVVILRNSVPRITSIVSKPGGVATVNSATNSAKVLLVLAALLVLVVPVVLVAL